uniref:Uncharacterized protein n=3 Tax=Ciona intestinalis TaxID=7719 RepID=F7BGM1_CIOIN
MFEQAKTRNAENKKRVERSLDVFYAELSSDYLREMNQASGEASEETLDKLHKKIVSSVTAKLKSKVPFTSIRENAIETCEKNLKKKRKDVKAAGVTYKGVFKRAALGATTGGLSGGLFGPVGALFGGAVGAVGGAFSGTEGPVNVSVDILKWPSIRRLQSLNL